MNDLVIGGPMGAGKSTVGAALARTLGLRFVDLDRRIAERAELSIPELFARGEATFRAEEAAALSAWLNRPASAPHEVLALGGGTLENGELIAALKQRATIVGLSATPQRLLSRLDSKARSERPLLAESDDPERSLADLLERRRAGYARVDFVVDTESLEPNEVVAAVLRRLYRATDGAWHEPPSPLVEDLPESDSVRFGRGAAPRIDAPRIVVLWDRHLPGSHRVLLESLLSGREGSVLIERPGGELIKSTDSLESLWRELLAAQVDRDTPLVVVGGGTLTDLGGLVAHTFKRGLPLHLVPTTLLAQLDAALGGKNGINLDLSKNAIGTTRLPASVTIDPLFLLTLPEVELSGAMAEAAKSGLIGDAKLVEDLERHAGELLQRQIDRLEAVSARAAAVKLRIVARDLDEQNERRKLNFGHTLGHALESVGAKHGHPIAHGAAVSIGMVFATYLSARLGLLEDSSLLERVPHLLQRFGLPTATAALDDARREELMAAMSQDKKRRRGIGHWVLPVRTGRVVCREVEPSEVQAALESWG